MGYPMTWKRLLSRNQVADGTYDVVPERFALMLGVNRNPKDDGNDAVGEVRRMALDNAERWARMFAGDLRRLERDTVDERATCSVIANRTGIDMEVVATVLKEFFAW